MILDRLFNRLGVHVIYDVKIERFGIHVRDNIYPENKENEI